jgi:hypothetical protein
VRKKSTQGWPSAGPTEKPGRPVAAYGFAADVFQQVLAADDVAPVLGARLLPGQVVGIAMAGQLMAVGDDRPHHRGMAARDRAQGEAVALTCCWSSSDSIMSTSRSTGAGGAPSWRCAVPAASAWKQSSTSMVIALQRIGRCMMVLRAHQS